MVQTGTTWNAIQLNISVSIVFSRIINNCGLTSIPQWDKFFPGNETNMYVYLNLIYFTIFSGGSRITLCRKLHNYYCSLQLHNVSKVYRLSKIFKVNIVVETAFDVGLVVFNDISPCCSHIKHSFNRYFRILSFNASLNCFFLFVENWVKTKLRLFNQRPFLSTTHTL